MTSFRAKAHRILFIPVTLSLMVGGLVALSSPGASADTAPAPGIPATVSADGLPTWQVNGVVWDSVVVGNTAYVTGEFTRARPPGVAVGGAGEVDANNVFAFDITTGNRVASFNHQLNGQGLNIVKSPDNSRVYVVGDFTTVDGAVRNHVAAFDTATNALNTAFKPSVSARVATVTANNSTVWFGGNFFSVNGQTRRRLAAVNASNGSNLPWAPTADDNQVTSMVLAPDQSRVIIGGKFSTINGQPALAMGSVDAVSGASLPWAINQKMNNAGTGSSITSLSTDGTNIFGTGYAYQTGNFEGTFSADPDSGDVNFINDCHGDTYDAAPVGKVLYAVSHAHDCRWARSFPQTDQNWAINMRHAFAWTTEPSGELGIGPDNYGWNYNGLPISSLLQWWPVVNIGSYTGQSQAAWTVTGNSDYVVLGGEFPSVNNVAQQGLVRFASTSKAPNLRAPTKIAGAPATSAIALPGGVVRVAWQSAYDMDNESLTYNVYRSDKPNVSIYTTTSKSNYWTYPMLGFRDTTAVAGSSYTYTVKVNDPFNNRLNLGASNSVTATAAGQASAYSNDVVGDGATAFWRLGEGSGSAVYDYANFNDATAGTGVSRGATGAINGDSDNASTFSGASAGVVVSPAMPTTPAFSAEAWVKTSTKRGGKIVGYGGSSSGDSGSYDRHVYMDNAGHIIFGVYPGGVRTVSSGTKTYNDNQWHHIVASQGSAGIVLYIDGKKISSDASTTTAQDYAGYWRIGGDNLNGWPNQPSSNYIGGVIDDVAIYPTALPLSKVRTHYTDSGRSLGGPAAPTDTYGKAIVQDTPDLYWRLGETAGTTAVDVSGNLFDGIYAGGYTLGRQGGVSGTTDKAAKFDGISGTVGSAAPITNPTNYSEELWFNTTTTHGGKLVGFGNAQSGQSSAYDRHVYMENSGQLTFGVWTGFQNTITSPQAYNNGQWHHMVATQSSGDGMKLFVDGVLVGTNPQTQAQDYTGYWRVGGDSDWGGDSPFFDGVIDEVAIYSKVLGAGSVASHYAAGGGQLANVNPQAGFTSTTVGRVGHFDGTTSSDSDGTVDSYDWDFGDGTTHGSGSTPDHTYTSDGTYTVVLKVTDNRGGVDTIAHDVTVANVKPTARFTSSSDRLVASMDGTTSTDSDGTVASYSWNWGDNTPDGSGSTPDHTYATDGTYTVTLTVTDNDGGTDTVAHDVTVAAPTGPTPLASDTFERTRATGWGAATTGGNWVLKGAATNFSVGSGTGSITTATVGTGPWAYLDGVSSSSTDSTVTLSSDKPATGTGLYAYLIGRELPTGGGYRAGLNLRANGTLSVVINRRTAANVQTAVAPAVVVPGLTWAAGAKINMRFVADGNGTTALKVKVWAAAESEPAAWLISTTDSTADMQGAGSVGLMAYLASNVTNAPVAISFDNYSVATAT